MSMKPNSLANCQGRLCRIGGLELDDLLFESEDFCLQSDNLDFQGSRSLGVLRGLSWI
jgi:hypothetical protein